MEMPDVVYMYFFLVKLLDWKEIKAYEPKTTEEFFSVAVNLESKNKGMNQTLNVNKSGKGNERMLQMQSNRSY